MKNKIDFGDTVDLCAQGGRWSPLPTEFKDERTDGMLISREMLEKRVRALAGQISADHQNCDELLVIPVLKGAFVFAADLIREIHRSGGPGIAVDFIKASTYGNKLKFPFEESREVRIELAPENIEGRQILVVEDIIDQCFTMPVIVDLLRERKAKSVKICVLIKKKLYVPDSSTPAYRKSVDADYTGFRIPDVWVAGYGIDAGQNFRELPFIVVVNEAFYRQKVRTAIRA